MNRFKLLFAVAVTAVIGSVGFAGYDFDPASVSDPQAAQLQGGSAVPVCGSWAAVYCSAGNRLCSGNGFATNAAGAYYGAGQGGGPCGASVCGLVAQSVNGCGTVP